MMNKMERYDFTPEEMAEFKNAWDKVTASLKLMAGDKLNKIMIATAGVRYLDKAPRKETTYDRFKDEWDAVCASLRGSRYESFPIGVDLTRR